ncbi:MAG: hypothetical protein MUC34_09415 [Anaerolineae bacterium]|nr:hypothetical protein [Anaerolineae bacterium]
MAVITNRICGVCPEAHHMAAAKAADAVGREGGGRGLPCKAHPHRRDAARAVVQRVLLHRPHNPLLRAGRTGLHHGTGCAGGGAQHPRRHPQGRAGGRRQGHPDAEVRPHGRRDDRRAEGASLHFHPGRRQPRHHRGTAPRDRGHGPVGD